MSVVYSSSPLLRLYGEFNKKSAFDHYFFLRRFHRFKSPSLRALGAFISPTYFYCFIYALRNERNGFMIHVTFAAFSGRRDGLITLFGFNAMFTY